MKLFYTKGWKYQVDEDFEFQLHHNFGIKQTYDNGYYRVDPSGLVKVYRGCCWDGATFFLDTKWMMKPSLIHDILHWLIAAGVIGEWANDLIDMELDHWIRKNKGWSWLYRFRGGYIRLATNQVNQKKGKVKKVHWV